MGKPKQPDPEPEKIVRTLGENLSITVTEEEKKYRNKNGPDDVTDISKEHLKCTVCSKNLSDIVKKSAEPFVHMVLGVLMCKECSSFYGDGYFSVDEDGDDKYCRWCGQGGTLYLCSKCTCAFCKKCIKQNLSRQDVKDLESDDWKCLICNPKPLYECRTVCWALQEYAQAKKNSQLSDDEAGEEESKIDKSKKNKSKRSSRNEPKPSTSKKRKASEVEEEPQPESGRESKRRKSSDSTSEAKNKGGSTSSTPSRSSRNRPSASMEIIDVESEEEIAKPTGSKSKKTAKKKETYSEDEDFKSPSRKSRKSKRDESDDEDSKPVASKSKKSSDPKEQPSKRPTRSPQKQASVVEVVSDDEAEEVDADNDTDNISSSKRKSSKSSKQKKKHKTSSKSKKSATLETSPKPTPKSRGKKDVGETPVKRSERSTKGRHSFKDHSDSESKEDNLESKGRISRRKSDEEPARKSLTLPKNAKKEVVQAGGFINSALRDIGELSNLILNRCEKLCSKSVQSTDDLLQVFSKLTQLTEAVHQNLSLIEKGLEKKIIAWKNENLKDNKDIETGKETGDELTQEEQDTVKEKGNEDGEKINTEEEMVVEEETANQDKNKSTEKMNVDEENNAEPSDPTDVKENDNENPISPVVSSQENVSEEPNECEGTENEKQKEENVKNGVSDDLEDNNQSDELKELNIEAENNSEVNSSDLADKNIQDTVQENSEMEDKEKSTVSYNNEEDNASNETGVSGNDPVCEKNETEEPREMEISDNKNDLNSVNSDIIPEQDSKDNISRPVSQFATVANNLEDNGVSEGKVVDKLNSYEKEWKHQDDSDSPLEEKSKKSEDKVKISEDKVTISEDKVTISEDKVTINEESPEKDTSQSPVKQTEGLKNGSADEEKAENRTEERKIENKEEEKKNEEETISRTPSADNKSSSRPHQSSSGDRNRYPQDSRWSGGDRDRDRDRDRSWNRDRDRDRFDRGWSGGRGGSPYPRGGDRWHRGSGWGYHR